MFNIFVNYLLHFGKMLTFFSLWFMYGGYKIGPSRIDPIYEQVVTRMYIAIYLEIEIITYTPQQIPDQKVPI
jgi:hypothetical protein